MSLWKNPTETESWLKGATAAIGILINLLQNEGTVVLTGEELIISIFLLFLSLNILLFHMRARFLLEAEEIFYSLEVKQHTIIGTMSS